MMKGSSTLNKVRDEAINRDILALKGKQYFPLTFSERSEETFLINVGREPINMNLLALNEK